MQLKLFHNPPAPPHWWTPADAEIIAYYHAQEERTDEDYSNGPGSIHARADEYTCRRCSGWASSDGRAGLCMRRFIIHYLEWLEDEPNDPEPFFWREAEPNDPTRFTTRGFDQCEEWDPVEF